MTSRFIYRRSDCCDGCIWKGGLKKKEQERQKNAYDYSSKLIKPVLSDQFALLLKDVPSKVRIFIQFAKLQTDQGFFLMYERGEFLRKECLNFFSHFSLRINKSQRSFLLPFEKVSLFVLSAALSTSQKAKKEPARTVQPFGRSGRQSGSRLQKEQKRRTQSMIFRTKIAFFEQSASFSARSSLIAGPLLLTAKIDAGRLVGWLLGRRLRIAEHNLATWVQIHVDEGERTEMMIY